MRSRKPAPQALQAVGANEAAALMGVHFSTPAKMMAKGLLSGHLFAATSQRDRKPAIFDGSEAEADYLAYEEHVESLGGKSDRRPRSYLHHRPEVLRHLAKIKTPIAFSDAIGVPEAAEILRVHTSFIPRMIRRGDIVGRATWALRRSDSTLSRHYIISRASCLENVRNARLAQASGKKVGRPRNLS